MSKIIDKNTIDEAEFIALLKKGDEVAFRTLVKTYQERLINIAYGITQDKEESGDIVQEVFLKAYRNISRFKGESKLYTWLCRITVNESLNLIRKWKRRLKKYHREIDETDPKIFSNTENDNPEALLRKKEITTYFNKGVAKLSEKEKAVLVLKETEGLSYDEIAKLLKINRGTVSSRLFNARRKLIEIMKKQFMEA